jgi:hypothetical protein
MATALVKSLIVLIVIAEVGWSQSADPIPQLVRTTLEKQMQRPFWFRLRSITFGFVPYVFDVETANVKYDGNGAPKEQSSAKAVFTPIDGVLLYTPTEFMGKPVDEDAKRSWKRKTEEGLAQAKRRSESEKAKIRAAEEKRIRERAVFWREFMNVFRFETLDRRARDGRSTTVFSFSPIAGYRPFDGVDTKFLPKLRGQIWIDDRDEELVHIDLEFIEDVSSAFGLLGKVYRGSRYRMELAKQIDGLWLPVLAETTLRMRQLVSKSNQTYTVRYSNYRKFSSEVKILDPAVN